MNALLKLETELSNLENPAVRETFENMTPEELNHVINQLARLLEIRRELIFVLNKKLAGPPEEFTGKHDAAPKRKMLDIRINDVPFPHFVGG